MIGETITLRFHAYSKHADVPARLERATKAVFFFKTLARMTCGIYHREPGADISISRKSLSETGRDGRGERAVGWHVPLGPEHDRLSEFSKTLPVPKKRERAKPWHEILAEQNAALRAENERLKATFSFVVVMPADHSAGEIGFTDTVDIRIGSGDPGGEPGEFELFIKGWLAEWYDGAGVATKAEFDAEQAKYEPEEELDGEED